MPKPPHKCKGRPRQLYDPARTPGIIRALAQAGHTNAEMANLLNVSSKCLWQWRDKYPEVKAALEDGKSVIDQMVVDALVKRAQGYKYEETEVKGHVDENGKFVGLREAKTIKKFMASDVTACIFWLKNRRPDEWRDVYKQEHSGDVVLSIIPPSKPNVAQVPPTD